MKQVVDINGLPINGLFKKDDGSIIVQDDTSLLINRSQHAAFGTINEEISSLKQQVQQLIGLLNGKFNL
jgi:hypothetical protein